jgi:hypothetical protein
VRSMAEKATGEIPTDARELDAKSTGAKQMAG